MVFVIIANGYRSTNGSSETFVSFSNSSGITFQSYVSGVFLLQGFTFYSLFPLLQTSKDSLLLFSGVGMFWWN